MTEINQSKKKSSVAIVTLITGLVVGFFGGMEYKAYQIRSSITDSMGDIFDTSSVEEEKEIIEEKEVLIEKEMKEEVELATLKVMANSFEEKQILSGGFGSPAVANEGAKFVIVSLFVTNTTDETFDFYIGDGFQLIDGKDRKFNSYDDTIGNVKNYLSMRELAPSVKESGVIVYEVPEDAGNFAVLIGKAGTNEIYKLKLENAEQESD